MNTLMKKIKEDAKKSKLSGITISKLIDVSRGMVSNYLNNETDMPLLKFIKLINCIYENKPDKISSSIQEFIAKTSRKDNLQEIFEWVSNRGDEELFAILYNKFFESDELTEDFKVYRLLYMRNKREISATEFYIQVEKLKENKYIQEETKILLKIATLYSFWDLRSYNMMFLADGILEDIENIESEYLRASFKIRTLEMLATGYLKRNELEKVIDIGNSLITEENETNFPLPINSIYILFAEAYLFRSPSESLKYIKKAIKMFDKLHIKTHSLRLRTLELTHDFIKIYHGEYDNLYLHDPAEQAHLLAKIGEKEKALKILDDLEKKNGKLSAYQYYYKGITTGDIKYMQQSLCEFINMGDSFYAQLPNKYLIESL